MKYCRRIGRIGVALLSLALLAALLGGCASTPSATGAPTLTITKPANGATVDKGDITVETKVTNFKIVDKQGQANVAGEGHLHFYLDTTAPTAAGQPAIPPDTAAKWAHVSGTEYKFDDVAAGQHAISVELVNNDHTPLNPPVVVGVTVTAK